MAEPGRKISVVIIACNEAKRIGDCLESVQWADDIVVVDSGSCDATVEIARNLRARVFHIPWLGFGAQKQAAVQLAAHELVLSVDCDERVTPELAAEIQSILAKDTIAPAYSLPRRTFLGSREIRHCGWYPDRTIRLFDRRRAHFSDDPVHEKVLVDGQVTPCRYDLLHYSFTGMADLVAKMNRYTDLSARQMFEKGRRYRLTDITIRPLFAFFRTLVIRAGFLDGVAGLVVAAANGMSVFVKYAKLRELGNGRD